MEILELLFFLVELMIDLVGLFTADASSRTISSHSHAIKSEPAKPVDPMLAACGYLAFGWLVGMLSLWLVPDVMIKGYWPRLAGLLVLPLCAGLVMSWIGTLREHHGKSAGGLQKFSYGFCFSFAMSLARFIWGHAA